MRENEMKTTTKFFPKKSRSRIKFEEKNEPIEQSTGMTCKTPKAQIKGKKGKRIPTQGSHYLINYK